MIERATLRGLWLAVAAVLALPAGAETLYKLVDRQGRVTYSDSEPKHFDGTVTRIESDAAPTLVPSAKPAEGRPAAAAPSGLAVDRRRVREDLEKKLRAAQARVEAARKALDEGGDPLPEELQTVQRRYPLPKSGEQPRNPNCFVATDPGSGVESLNCPSRVPEEAFYDRQKKLARELHDAEEALAVAERAYRRGTD